MPLISVILPTWNRPAETRRAIQSVVDQSFSDWELIVVDDGSTCDIKEVISSFADHRIRLIEHETNRGAPAARNTGIDAARGEWIAFIDSDAEWMREKLERQMQLVEDSSCEDLGIVTCGMQIVDGEKKNTMMPTARGRVFDAVLRRRVGVWDTSTFLVKRSISPRFDEAFPAYQDFDFLAQLTQKAQLDYVDAPLVINHADTKGPRVSDNNLQGRLCVLEKYHDELDSRPETLSHHHVRIALKYYFAGQMRSARSHLAKAAIAYPRRIQHWGWLTGAACGQRGLWLALRLFRHETTH